MQNISIKTPGGFRLAASVHSPNEPAKGLAVLCPGYLDTKNYEHLVTLANDLAASGHTAVRFDPLGTWESDGPIDRYSMSQYLEDIRTVIDLMCQGQAYENIFAMGHSIGGMLSLVYAARDKRVTKAVAIMSPYAYARPNLASERDENSSWAKTGYRPSHRNLPGKKEIKEINVPYSFVLDAAQYNAVEEASKIKVPVLLIAGEKDEIVPVEYLKMIYDRLGGTKKLVVMKGMGHDYRQRHDDIKAIDKEVISFL